MKKQDIASSGCKCTHIVNPYLFIMSFLLLAVSTAATIYVTSISPDETGWILVGMEVALYIAVLSGSWEYFSSFKIQENGLRFAAPFRRTIFISYEKMVEVGIDFGMLSGQREFWIYFATEPIPKEYRNRINRLKMSRDCLRIRFRQDVYNDLLHRTPKEISKQLSRSYSVIRAYSAEDDD